MSYEQYGLSYNLASVLCGGINTWKVKHPSDGAYYSLGSVYDANIDVSPLMQADGLRREHVYGWNVEIKAKMVGTNPTYCLNFLGNKLSQAALSHKINLLNGQYYSGELGFSWSFDSSADFDGLRYVEVTADRRILLTDFAALISEIPPGDGSQTGSDELYGFAPGMVGVPAGATAFEIRPYNHPDDYSWETIGDFRNARIRFNLTTRKDHRGMTRCNGGVVCAVEVDMMQTSQTEKNKLITILSTDPDFRITLADQTMVTFDQTLGISLRHQVPANADEAQFTHLTAGGIIPLASFASLFSWA